MKFKCEAKRSTASAFFITPPADSFQTEEYRTRTGPERYGKKDLDHDVKEGVRKDTLYMERAAEVYVYALDHDVPVVLLLPCCHRDPEDMPLTDAMIGALNHPRTMRSFREYTYLLLSNMYIHTIKEQYYTSLVSPILNAMASHEPIIPDSIDGESLTGSDLDMIANTDEGGEEVHSVALPFCHGGAPPGGRC